ncbi:DUF192 domain-containing protein [Halapricum hydrolyticum]|uniref:DUF192 domain-containing protein n=1 Tax=Halapricum hydrolyticum TaxID=2979991 RepID=A0AAE3IA68_9EURY|nr:DUF192 domain-containing protein [Halapricum hydrolyticum]MCU4717547.1 DUF192 domain-containing protein [Halapricum hydrolyticum]MCU4726711.1 DUF192 domain-containing protein [Halapricum hydrolyticum]
MDRRTYLRGVVAGVAVLAGCAGRGSERTDAESTANRPMSGSDASPTTGQSTIHEYYETTTVRALTADGETLGTVTAAIADTPELRYLGLSDTEHLPDDRGMLFVFESIDDRSFVMRRMDFGIDIVYADGEGRITTIHHAPAPDHGDGNDQRYPGRGQYVLEVTYGWTTDRGVETGDRLAFELPG